MSWGGPPSQMHPEMEAVLRGKREFPPIVSGPTPLLSTTDLVIVLVGVAVSGLLLLLSTLIDLASLLL